MTRSVVTGLALLAVAAAAGCGLGSGETPRRAAPPPPAEATLPPPPPLPPPAAPPVEPACSPGERRALGSARRAYFAVVRAPTRAFRAPGGVPFARLGVRNVNGARTVLGVLGSVLGADCRPRWYHVQLPVTPNGTTGYVPASAVEVGTVSTRIVVDLSERRVTLYRSGRKVLEAAVAVGTPHTPTPTGRFYVDQRLIPDDPTGPWGPGAIGISAHSEVLTDWVQGGPIAIHGTNLPSSLGKAASAGCIRVDNATLRRLFSLAREGTPVLVRA